MRWRIFVSEQPDYLSALAVVVLSSSPRLIKVLEPRASLLTTHKRTIRTLSLSLLQGTQSIYHEAKDITTEYIAYSQHPVFSSIRTLCHQCSHFSQTSRSLLDRYNQHHAAWEREFGPGSVWQIFLMLCLLVLYTLIKLGWVDFMMRQRFWALVTTGTMVLST
ncbi:hypothetical protein AMATHDRAFT_68421 [Amanita thiersii Skay4041]|uniref:Uncharacterized protein n=1 Tax=Amanita thiersii Skay4041 TaxID=703135 RepID=A0A2A9NHG8_9AGAR|nr:hypothetical protein AMATHDRAFT_68421 [Amanita thiersii Skay4041]